MYLPVINKSVTIIVPSGEVKGTYTSIVHNMNTSELILSKPVSADGHGEITLTDGLQVIVDYQDDKDVPCRFETMVINPLNENPEWLLLKCPDKIERHQRREEYRIPLCRPVELTIHSKSVAGIMNDLSGGGCSVWLDDTNGMKAGDTVEVSFVLSSPSAGIEPKTVRAYAEAVNVQNRLSAVKGAFCSLKFSGMSTDMKQGILEYIFNRHAIDVALNSVGREVMY
ncbi:flagellar brake protein [Bacillus sp. SCS-153A]|uniref:flagellar brake protein n=1 Tax=Rossellomorea sedimentorum TaxID=3115294 RepID=UPI0039059101